MNDLQREVRAAFEKQQADLGDLTDVRHRMLRTALAARESRRTQVFRAAVGLAAVLIAATAVGATIYIRARSHSLPAATQMPSASASVQASPTSAPAPTAVSNPLQVSASTPVILYHDPVTSDQIDGITWDGTSSGRIAATGGASGFTGNPAGTLYAGFRDSSIHDRSGQVVALYDSGNQKGFGIWADDGRHYCQMVSASQLPPPGGEPATLRLGAPGEAVRTVAQIGTMGQQFGVWVAACSMAHDRAVVLQGGGSSPRFWVVQLSTGRVLLDSARLGITTGGVVASADAQFIADILGGPGQSHETTIYSPTGSVLGRVVGAVQEFSWDGTLAVVTGSDGTVSVIRWREGTRLWAAPQGLTFYNAMAEPDGYRIVVGLRNPQYPQTSGFPPLDVYVVGADGKASLLLQRVAL